MGINSEAKLRSLFSVLLSWLSFTSAQLLACKCLVAIVIDLNADYVTFDQSDTCIGVT